MRPLAALGDASYSIYLWHWPIFVFYRVLTGHTVAGWSSLAVSIWAIGGLQLLAIGVVGEYIGKIYLETKARPRYRIETELDDREAEL